VADQIVNQVIGTVRRVIRAEKSTVVDFLGPTKLDVRSAQDVKFVLKPKANAADYALLAASIGRKLELAGIFKLDESNTVRANAITNIIVG
jgi:hypothetical protein